MNPGRAPQLGLFILWEKARDQQARILDDLHQRFEILHVYEVRWSPGRVNDSFRRFYSDIPIRGASHRYNKGAGPFIAVTLLDHAPVLEERMTTRGVRTVNSRFLDAKLLYRGWADPLGVHCGENERENTRDITMLLSEDPRTHQRRSAPPWSGRIESLRRDLAGAGGWASARELFTTLNETVRYVVLGPGDPRAALDDGREPVEFLTDRYSDFHTILGARHRAGVAPLHGGMFRLSVRGRAREVAIRRVGDQLVDDGWARELLASRELDSRGIYRLPALASFEVRAYRALMHKAQLSPAERESLARAGQAVGAAGWTAARLAEPDSAGALLSGLMKGGRRAVVRPRDLGIYFNHRRLGRSWPAARDVADAVRGGGRAGVQMMTGSLHIGYHGARDRGLAAAPWIRRLRPSQLRKGG